MWQIAITIVYAETLVEQRFRHDRDLGDADLVLIFCGGNHYCGAGNQFLNISLILGHRAVILPQSAAIALYREANAPQCMATVCTVTTILRYGAAIVQ